MPGINEMRADMSLRRICKITIAAILGLLVAVNIYLIAARLIYHDNIPKIFGLAQLVVVSGSMQPAIGIGDLIVIKEQDSYRVNDIVTYRSNKSVVTHRIVETNDTHVITQGDANNVADGAIPLSSIEGKVIMRIPGAGDITFFLRTPVGIISVALGALLLIIIPSIIEKHKGNRC